MTQTTITSAEMKFCMYHLDLEGGFTTTLIKTIFAADSTNREKLARAFPDLVEVIEKYNKESGYWQDLVYRWNQENQNHLIY